MDSDQTAPWKQSDQGSCCCFHENALEMQQTPSLMQGGGGHRNYAYSMLKVENGSR